MLDIVTNSIVRYRMCGPCATVAGGRASARADVPPGAPDRWFIGTLDLTWNWEHDNEWILAERFGYHARSGDEYMVPAGFKTDFASIPRVFWAILPPTGKYGPAAIIHDYLCVTKSVPRARADEVFLEAMTLLQVEPWKRNLMYWVVRAYAIITGKK